MTSLSRALVVAGYSMQTHFQSLSFNI